MPRRPQLEAAIARGAAFLAGQQDRDGGFTSFSSSGLQKFEPELGCRTTFVPSLILLALAQTDTPDAVKVRRQAAQFLLREKSPRWSFNYWAIDEPERRERPYPDDLDDTFCALGALYSHDSPLINEAALASIVKLLLATEQSVGGPYRTWLVPKDSDAAWQDVDVAVNANIAYFLSLAGIDVPPLNDYIQLAIAENRLASPYYPSIEPILYYVSRVCNSAQRPWLVQLAQQRLTSADTALNRALCICALLRLGEVTGLEKAVADLLEAQSTDGSWPAAAFCLDPVRGGKTYYNGSAALSTAFSIEALQRYLQVRPAAAQKQRGRTDLEPLTKSRRSALTALAHKQCHGLQTELRNSVLHGLQTVIDDANGQEICMLPRWFATSLKESSPLQEKALDLLGLANAYGWLAYTIYDDFLDEEGKPRLLPAANAAMRRSMDGFIAALPADETFMAFVRRTFDTIDGANAWELTHCRLQYTEKELFIDGKLPVFKGGDMLAARSLGHALGPLAVLKAAGHDTESAASRQIQTAIEHYLIARQLNDDCHDWQADIQRGQVSYAAAAVLRELSLPTGNYAFSELLPRMQRQFWHRSLPRICKHMQKHITAGRESAVDSGLFRSVHVLDQLFDQLEASVQTTLRSQAQAGRFLKHYQKNAAQ